MKKYWIAASTVLLLLSFFFPWMKHDDFLGIDVKGITLGIVFLMFGGSNPHRLQAFLILALGVGILFVFLSSLFILIRLLRNRPTFRWRLITLFVGVLVFLAEFFRSGDDFFPNVAWGAYVSLLSLLLLSALGKDKSSA
jgi:hypothetical protein